MISAVGNHDDDQGGAALFKKYAGPENSLLRTEIAYFIVIDNAIGNMTDAQFSKLEEELKKSSDYAHRFVIMHKPAISPYFQSWYRPERNPWSYRFMKLCEKYKVDIVFSGHEHMFNEKTFGGREIYSLRRRRHAAQYTGFRRRISALYGREGTRRLCRL